jgi:hypothetical protein
MSSLELQQKLKKIILNDTFKEEYVMTMIDA